VRVTQPSGGQIGRTVVCLLFVLHVCFCGVCLRALLCDAQRGWNGWAGPWNLSPLSPTFPPSTFPPSTFPPSTPCVFHVLWEEMSHIYETFLPVCTYLPACATAAAPPLPEWDTVRCWLTAPAAAPAAWWSWAVGTATPQSAAPTSAVRSTS
jgi:hypothetical protein